MTTSPEVPLSPEALSAPLTSLAHEGAEAAVAAASEVGVAPVEDTSTQDPSTQDPSAQDPSAQDPSAQDPSAQDALTQDPLTEDPLTGDAPAEDPESGVATDATLRELSASADPRVTATRKLGRYRLGVFAGDLVVITMASTVASIAAGWPALLRSRTSLLQGTSMELFGAGVVVGWVVLIFLLNGYSSRRLGAGTEEYKSVMTASVITGGLVAGFAYLTWTRVPRVWFLTLVSLGFLLLPVWRYAARQVVRAFRERDAYVMPTVVLGTRPEVERVIGVLRRESWAGYAVQGVVLTDDETSETEEVLGAPVVGTTATLKTVLETLETQTLLIASHGGVGGLGVRRLMWQLEDSDVEVVVAPYFNDIAGARIHVRPVAGMPLMQLRQPDLTGTQRLLKRVSGLVIALGVLTLLLPVLAVTAVLVRRSSPGPVLFKQTRVGRNGREFECLKFRTMYVDAERRLDEYLQQNEGNELLFKMKDDPRVTPVGAYLRRFSLDELPQLWNVVRGDMSLVGPRPPLPREVANYSTDLQRRLLVTPGMTGLWQVSGRSDLSLRESTRLDLYYVDNWSFLFDVAILLRTVRAVISGRGAY